MLATPGSKIRLQGFSGCADGDRDLGPRGQFPIDPGLQPRGTEPRAFGTRPSPRQPLGRCPDVMASQSEDTEVAIPEAFEPSQPLRSAASVPPSHSRERPGDRVGLIVTTNNTTPNFTQRANPQNVRFSPR
jgi:hypothetical protein